MHVETCDLDISEVKSIFALLSCMLIRVVRLCIEKLEVEFGEYQRCRTKSDVDS